MPQLSANEGRDARDDDDSGDCCDWVTGILTLRPRSGRGSDQMVMNVKTNEYKILKIGHQCM